MTGRKPILLIVDDDQSVLDGLSRTLRSSFDVKTATSGGDALLALERYPDVAIVMSDMRMPVMTGATFLAKAHAVAPNTVRILLTGQADVDDAMAAINEGSIYRFLRKPCPPETMATALAAAMTQHRLMAAEKELLEQTLHGSVEALTDTLALASPGVFGIATRVKRLATELATRMGMGQVWQLEIAAMVCQLGAVSVPSGVFERRFGGLTPAEQEMLDRVPELSERLIGHIPRLEGVRETVRYSRVDFNAEGPLPLRGAAIPRAALILHLALDFEERLAAGDSPQEALARLNGASARYDRGSLDALTTLCTAEAPSVEVQLGALRKGMIVAGDIRTRHGLLLVARGQEVTVGLLSRLDNFGAELASKVVRVEARSCGPVLPGRHSAQEGSTHASR